MIPDNYGTHKTEGVRAWLMAHYNWAFHFTPTSSSWLNVVEGFFAKLTNVSTCRRLPKEHEGNKPLHNGKSLAPRRCSSATKGNWGRRGATGTSPMPWTSPNGPFRPGVRERFWMDPRRPWFESRGRHRRSRQKSMAGLKRTSRSWPVRHRQRGAIAGRCDCWPSASSNSNSSIRYRTKRFGGR